MIFLLIIASCDNKNKNNNPIPLDQTRVQNKYEVILDSIVSVGPTITKTMSLIYDNKNRVSKMIHKLNGKIIKNSVIEYKEDSNSFYLNSYDSTGKITDHNFKCEFNKNGNLIKTIYFELGGSTETRLHEYNDKNELIKINILPSNSYRLCEYNNSNIVYEKHYKVDGSLIMYHQMEYDNKKNPLKYYYVIHNPFPIFDLSENNPISLIENYPNGQKTPVYFTYKYNQEGYPTEATAVREDGTGYTIKYFYKK